MHIFHGNRPSWQWGGAIHVFRGDRPTVKANFKGSLNVMPGHRSELQAKPGCVLQDRMLHNGPPHVGTAHDEQKS